MATTQENKIIFSIEFTEKGVIRKIDGVRASVQKFEKQLKQATTANKQFNQTLSGRESMTTNAGLAGATLTELGRTISDMPYGIRGVANNLSQLSTLFVTMVSKVDDSVKGFARVGRAFKMLQAQMMGPLGLILLFQGALAALDFFAGSTKKAAKEVDKLNEALNKQKGLNESIQIYVDILKDATATEEQHIVAMAKLQKEGYDETIGSLEEYQAALKQKQKLDIAELQVSDKIAESEKKIAEAIKKRDTAQKLLDEAHASDVLNHSRQVRIDKANKIIESEKAIIDGQKINIKTFMNELANDPDVVGNPFMASLFGLKTTKSDDPKESEVAKIVKKLNEEVQKMSAENAEELIKIEKQLALDEIEQAEGSRKEKNEAIRLINEKFALELKEFREEELNEFKEFVSESVEESIKVIDSLYKDFLKKNKQAARDAQKFISDYIKEQNNLLRQSREQQKIFNQAFTSTSDVLGALNDLRQEHHQAQLDRLARERDVILLNDTLTQSEKESRIKEIEAKEIEAQKRKIKLERDMFTIEQTLMIAKTIMNAKFFAQQQLMMAQIAVQQGVASARQVALEGTVQTGKAGMSLGSFMSALGPAGVIAFGASIGVALASIKKARDAAKNQIANLVPEASSIAGGSAPAVQAPDFNVVGATQTSQLAQTIAGAEDKPIKAFVVASDVTTAQELERSTIEGASLG